MQAIFALVLVLFSSGYGAATARQIKALSDDDIRGLKEGRGMGLALADKLKLTAGQRASVQQAHGPMKASALALGSEIVELERQLDRAFAEGTIDEKRLGELTAAIAERQGRLRYAHLAAHIATRAVLTEPQIKAYDQARGYGSPSGHKHHQGH